MKSTIVWAALVAALAGYVLYDYRRAGRETLATGEERAFTASRDEVKAFKLTRGGETIALTRDGDEWRLTAPLEDYAEDATVDGFLYGLEMERLREFRDADDRGTPDWARFGLDKPGVVIEWTTPKTSERIEVSSKNAFDGSFYVRKGDRVLLGAAGLAQSTNRNVGSFRSRRIWRHADADVTRAEARFPERGRDFTVTRDARGWDLAPKPKLATDAEKIDKWVNAVEDLTAAEFVRDGLDPAALKSYGLDHPQLRVNLDYHVGEEKPGRWTLTLGPERGEDVYFYTSDRAVILKAPAATVRKLVVTPAYFRDGHPPFQFDVERAREVRVRVGPSDRVFKKGEGAWTLADAKPGESLNETELSELLTSARALAAVDFPGTSAVKGSPALDVRDADGHSLLKLVIGDEYKSRATWNQGASLRAVRVTSTAGEETFGLPKAQIETLIKERLIKK